MEHINTMYDKGYFKACLDIYNLLEVYGKLPFCRRSVKKYRTITQAILKEILQNSISRETFKMYGGNCAIYVSEDGKTVRITDKSRCG